MELDLPRQHPLSALHSLLIASHPPSKHSRLAAERPQQRGAP
jgi:hypothetical protein